MSQKPTLSFPFPEEKERLTDWYSPSWIVMLAITLGSQACWTQLLSPLMACTRCKVKPQQVFSVFHVLCSTFHVLCSMFCVPCSAFHVPFSVFHVLCFLFCVLWYTSFSGLFYLGSTEMSGTWLDSGRRWNLTILILAASLWWWQWSGPLHSFLHMISVDWLFLPNVHFQHAPQMDMVSPTHRKCLMLSVD